MKSLQRLLFHPLYFRTIDSANNNLKKISLITVQIDPIYVYQLFRVLIIKLFIASTLYRDENIEYRTRFVPC